MEKEKEKKKLRSLQGLTAYVVESSPQDKKTLGLLSQGNLEQDWDIGEEEAAEDKDEEDEADDNERADGQQASSMDIEYEDVIGSDEPISAGPSKRSAECMEGHLCLKHDDVVTHNDLYIWAVGPSEELSSCCEG